MNACRKSMICVKPLFIKPEILCSVNNGVAHMLFLNTVFT